MWRDSRDLGMHGTYRIYKRSENIVLDLSSYFLLHCRRCSGKMVCQLVGKETEVTRN